MRVQPRTQFFSWVLALKALKQPFGGASFCVLALLLGILSGCVAQSSYGLLHEAREKVAKARRVEPGSAQVARAEVALEAGHNYLREARYGQAEQQFLSAISISDRVLGVSAGTSESGSTASRVIVEPDPEPTAVQEGDLGPIAASEGADPLTSEEEQQAKMDRMSLPKQALAKYLAEKKKAGTPQSTPATAVARPQVPAAATGVAALTPAERVVPPASRPAAPARENEEPMELEPLRRVLRARITFDSNSAEISRNDTGLSQLDSLAQTLIESPSNSLLIISILGQNESPSLTDSRYQAVVEYMRTRGVPEDQIRLDALKKQGSSANLELYLIDH